MTFNTLGLTESLLRAVAQTGYSTPTSIQSQCIPAVLSGKDVMAVAQTGTGKTAGFTLPLLQLLGDMPRPGSNRAHSLILTPTRELAAQIHDSIETYGKYEKVRSAVVFGGVNINPQMRELRRGVDILVATPGRLLDLYQQNAVNFNDIKILILDEADRMLDMGFIRDIKKILALLPKKRQNLMFSATFSDEIRSLAKTICHNPVEIDVAPRNSTVEAISQKMYLVEKNQKTELLTQILRNSGEQTLVFMRTKHSANHLALRLEKSGLSAAAIHGNKSQAQRTRALDDFKRNKVQVLVATDIAARGIDINQLAMVVNFDMPHVSEDYIHRIGRTGRAGASGQAISLVSRDETKQLRDIERLIKRKIESASLTGYTLSKAAPEQRQAANDSERRPFAPRSRSGAGRSASSNGAGRSANSNGAGRSGSSSRREPGGSQPPKKKVVTGNTWKTF